MIDYPEIRQYIGKPIKPTNRLIILSLIVLMMIIATVVFLFATGYVNVSSPSKSGQVIT